MVTKKVREQAGRIKDKITADQEKGARRTLFQELWQDVYDQRRNIYKVNFIRGIWFGLGSLLGGTIIVALLITVLGWIVGLPGIGDFSEYLRNMLKSSN